MSAPQYTLETESSQEAVHPRDQPMIKMRNEAKSTRSHSIVYKKCTLSQSSLKNRGFIVKYDVYNQYQNAQSEKNLVQQVPSLNANKFNDRMQQSLQKTQKSLGHSMQHTQFRSRMEGQDQTSQTMGVSSNMQSKA